MDKTLAILGRQPVLGLAELESLYGPEHIRPIGAGAMLDIPAEEINFRRLGGTIKTARVLKVLDGTDWPSALGYLQDVIPGHLQYIEGKLTLGISVYGLDVALPKLNRDLLELKKIIKQTGRPVRIVPNKTLELNSAQVLHNKLTHKGGWELLVVRDGATTVLAQTLFVQDIEAYAARDQARPKRDARVGMLPPKLAQIIVNLAMGPVPLLSADEQSPPRRKSSRRSAVSGTAVLSQSINHTSSSAPRSFRADPPSTDPMSNEEQARAMRVLDPFCGTGVILQEALLMGYHALGTDLDERMVEYSRQNLEWLVGQYPSIEGHASVEAGDATTYKWPKFSAVASEVYLGRPLKELPDEASLKQIISDVNTITKKFLQNLSPQLKTGQRVSLALPAWRRKNGSHASLPLLDRLSDMGYNYLDFKHVRRGELLYFREGQIVARQLIRLEKR